MKKSLKRKETGSVLLGELIKSSRKKKNLTGKRLAELVGVNRTHISKIEHGVHAPDFLVAKKISEILDQPEIINVLLAVQHPDINTHYADAIKVTQILKERNLDFKTWYENFVSGKPLPPL